MASIYITENGAYLHKRGGRLIIDYCEPHTRDFNHELGEQNSQRI